MREPHVQLAVLGDFNDVPEATVVRAVTGDLAEMPRGRHADLEQIASLEPEWQPSFMRSIADIARCHGRENRPLEERAMDACATLAEDVAQSDKVRQAALLWWCNWCRWNATPERLARVKAFRADPLVARGDQSVVLRMKSELARAEGK